jgi:hypothetical protein
MQFMEDFRYIKNEKKFLEYAFDVLKLYFSSRDSFDDFYNKISIKHNKNLFLKIISFYKYLVKDGSFISYIRDNDQIKETKISYIDETYKFIAVFSLIEGLLGADNYEEFHRWLLKNHDFTKVPIDSKTKFNKLRSTYLKEFGATNRAIKFFNSLDKDTKQYLKSKIALPKEKHRDLTDDKVNDFIANFLYKIRSEFVHKSRLILETSNGKNISNVNGELVMSDLNLEDLKLIFERGFLLYFGYDFKK